MAEFGGGSSPGCHQRRCKTVPEAELPKALPALLMSQEEGAAYSRQRDAGCEQEENEVCSVHGVLNEPLGNRSATGNRHTRFLGEWFRSHPVGTALLILLLLVLVLALGVALAVQSAATQFPVTPPNLQCCPFDWIGYYGVCYYFSRDYSTWEQGQERCSQLNASLAIAKDQEAMDLLFRLRGNVDFWLGLRRQGERLQWEDGSSYSSRVPVLGNSDCVYLADDGLKSDDCSTRRPVSMQQGPSSPVTGAAERTFSTLGSASFTSQPSTGLPFLSSTLCLALPLRVTSVPLHPQCQRWAGGAEEKSLQSLFHRCCLE